MSVALIGGELCSERSYQLCTTLL